LENRRTEIQGNLKSLNSGLQELHQLELNDEGDFASANSESYTDNLLASYQLQELEEIEYSLKKINEGSDMFGVCEMCDDEITKERLEAKPFAIYCKICREFVEKHKPKK
jgi:DnaK suppressor protein